MARAATSMIFVATKQTRVCRDKTRLLSRQKFCPDKHTFVAIKDVYVFVAIKDVYVFVAIKMILVAAPANDRGMVGGSASDSACLDDPGYQLVDLCFLI